ncbi:MAG: hypothetical protein HZB98_02370, partial [Bacteroidia bacterium]|nr:hypothetical protein [Bacteroidia bacterium]
VTNEMSFSDKRGIIFWSDGYSYGTAEITTDVPGAKRIIKIKVLNGSIDIGKISVEGVGYNVPKIVKVIETGLTESFTIK